MPSMQDWPGNLDFKIRVKESEKARDPQVITIHWGLGICSTETEAASVYVQEGGLAIGTITVGLGIRTGVSVSVQRPQSNLKQKIIDGFDGLNIQSSITYAEPL